MMHGCHHRSDWSYTKTARFRDLIKSWEPPAAEDAATRRTYVLNRLNRVLNGFPPPPLYPLLVIRDRR